jgi:hypothetical protein
MSKASWLILAAAACGTAQAAETAQCPLRTNLPPTVAFRVDNDLLGGSDQDQGYTSGLQLTLVSPNLKDYTDDPCLPRPARFINRFLTAIQPAGGYDQQNMVFTINQSIYTPKDSERRDLIRDDRPYAGALLFGFGYNARKGDLLTSTMLQLGVVGPAAGGEQVQNGAHSVFGSERFRGWRNQLHNEPVFMLQHERLNRFAWGSGEWTWDAITHYGGALGTYKTFLNAGAELRFGKHLPDDFGSTPLSPAGENTAPSGLIRPGGEWRVHGFLTTDTKVVGRDITLDGNTFRDSHSVDKRTVVAYVGFGVAVMKGRWKFALAQYHSTREFDGQVDPPVFGSFTISRAL